MSVGFLKKDLINIIDKNKLEKTEFFIDIINKYSSDSIVVLNEKKEIINYSKSFQEWFLEENLLGKNFFLLMNKIVQMPNDFFREESYFLRVKEETEINRILKSILIKFHSEKNKIDRYIVILKDVTEKKEMQAQKDNFIATLTHDLKTPIRADILSLELLLKGRFGSLNMEQKEILEEMVKSNKFMLTMLDTLLAKYKYESGIINLNKTIFDINDLIKDCLKEIKFLFEERKVNIETEFSQKNIEIKADIIEIKRAIINILTNAIKFNKIGGKVIIKTINNNDTCQIIVEDTGIGMNEEKISHIFDKYVSYAKKFRRLGTGLGLYVTKKIINAHKGRIEVNSTVDKGSVFTIIIPKEIN